MPDRRTQVLSDSAPASPSLATTRRVTIALLCVAAGGFVDCSQAEATGGSTAGASAQAGAGSGSAGANGGGSAGSSRGGSTGNAGSTSVGGTSQSAGDFGVAGRGADAGAGASAGSSAAAGATNGGASGSAGSGGSASSDATIIPDPSWTCGMPDGIPSPTAGTLLFSAVLTVGAMHNVGNTQYGKRRQLDVSGGTISGEKLKGSVLSGGLDYELTLATGSVEVEQVLVYKTSDNTNLFVRNCGVAATVDQPVRIVPDIEAPSAGNYSWLNSAKLVGRRVVSGDKITLEVYDVSNVVAAATKIELKDPAGVPNTSWDCVSGSGTRGDSVFTENVTLGTAFSVNNAKRGSRNIIPISGGMTTGKVAGQILSGGADYQLAGSSGTTLDARYTLAPSDGALIIVRNCGPIDHLIPAFETAVDGPYRFLNEGEFLSSAPASGAGGVGITFYERK